MCLHRVQRQPRNAQARHAGLEQQGNAASAHTRGSSVQQLLAFERSERRAASTVAVALVMVAVVYALGLLIGGAVAALLAGVPAALRLLLTIALEVALMTWWLMPHSTRLLARWIDPRRSHAS